MHTRLISILTAVENALIADDPSPDEGTWHTARSVNFHGGIAQMNLSVKSTGGEIKPRGAILLQGFRLADDSICLKATFSWHGASQSAERAIYEKPGVDWSYESRRLAAEWAGGPPPVEQETAAGAAEEAGGERALA